MKKQFFKNILSVFIMISGGLPLLGMETPSFKDENDFLSCAKLENKEMAEKIVSFLKIDGLVSDEGKASSVEKVLSSDLSKRWSFDWCARAKMPGFNEEFIAKVKKQNGSAIERIKSIKESLALLGINFIVGSSSLIVLVPSDIFGKKLVLYFPATKFYCIENSYNPYEFQLLSRAWYSITFDNVRKKYDITRVELRKMSVVDLRQDKEKTALSDNGCCLCSDYVDFDSGTIKFIGSDAGKVVCKELLSGALGEKVNEDACTFLRDLILVSIKTGGLWDIFDGHKDKKNAGLVKNGKGEWVLQVYDCEAPALGGSHSVYTDDGKQKLDAPWGSHVDQGKIQRLGRIGIKQFFGFAFDGNPENKLAESFAEFISPLVTKAKDPKDLSAQKLCVDLKSFESIKEVVTYLA